MPPTPHAAYLDAASHTASPGRLVVMLCERLVADVDRALAAVEAHDREAAHAQFVHAQEIVLELLVGLDTTRWEDGAGLAQVYVYLVERLIAANVGQDVAVARECRQLSADLASMWAEALAAAEADS